MMERPRNWESGRSGKGVDDQVKDRRPLGNDENVAMATTPAAAQRQAEAPTPGRPSAFLEGSMNDRVSAVPPSRFTGQEAAMERYMQEGQATVQSAALMKPLPAPPVAASGHQANGSTHETTKAEKDPQRRSGIFRLGKSIASAFNPAAIWDDFTNKKKQDADEPKTKGYMVDEHRQRVEKIYAEMKKDGRLPAPTVAPRPAHGQAAPRTLRRKHGTVQGVEPGEVTRRASEEVSVRKDNATVEDNCVAAQPPKDTSMVTSPAGESISSHRTPFHIRKRSVPNLKKVKSGIHRLTSDSLVALGSVPAVPTVTVEDTDANEPDRKLRTQISRKDLQRQQKLSKRVSDLEGKLQHARRELDEVMGQRPALRPLQPNTVSLRAFGPGTLPSLPSERLLFADRQGQNYSPGKTLGEPNESSLGPGGAVKISLDSQPGSRMEISRELQAAEVAVDQPSKQEPTSSPSKRKSIGDGLDEDETDAQGQASSHANSTPSKRRRMHVDINSPTNRSHHPAKDDTPTNTTSTPVVSTEALLDQVAKFEHALEPRPMVIQSIAEETMTTMTTVDASCMILQQPASAFGTPSKSPPASWSTSASPARRVRRRGSKIPRRSMSPPAGAPAAGSLKLKASLPSFSAAVGEEPVKAIPPMPALSKGIVVAAGASERTRQGNAKEDFEWPDDVF